MRLRAKREQRIGVEHAIQTNIFEGFDGLAEPPYNKNTEENVDGYKNVKFNFL